MPITAAIFGNLTIDHNKTESGEYIGPGGSVYFAAKTFANLGAGSTIISSYGEDFPKEMLGRTSFIPKSPDMSKTLVFHNIVRNSERIQTVENYGKLPELTKDLLLGIDLLVVAPILPNIPAATIRLLTGYYSQSWKLLLPQGFYRRITEGGKIKSVNWREAEQIVPFFDIIIASDKDFPRIEEFAALWSKNGPIVIITRAEKGCHIYQRGAKLHIPAFQADKIADSTGAGDVFAAAFISAYIPNRNLVAAATFAHAAACLSLRYLPNQLQYGYREIIDFGKEKEREINL